MPDLTEEKRKQLDDIVGKMHANNESDENIQTLVNDFKSKNTVQAPSALSRFGAGFYNTTVGPIVDTVKSIPEGISGILEGKVPDTLKNIAGVPQFQEAWNQAKQGNYLPAAMSFGEAVNPGARMAEGMMTPIAKDVKEGNYAGATGQMLGLGTSFAAPELAGRLGASKLGIASKAGLKAATPDLAMGGLKTGVGVGVGAVGKSMGVPSIVDYLVGTEMARPGLRQMGRGLAKGTEAFGDSWKGGPVESPGVEPPSQAPQMKVEPPGVPQTPKVPQTPQTSQTPQVSQASPESMIEEATRGGPGTPPEMPVQAPISNNQNLRNLMRPNALEIENPNIQSQANADWAKGKVEAPKVEAPKSSLGEVEPPKTRRSPDRPYEDPDNPLYRGKITKAQIEEAQSMDKLTKETILARHLIKNNIDLDSIPKTSEYLEAISQEAGLKRVASLRTLENAIKRARELKINPPEKK